MWDDIRIQCSDAYEIAEALINNEVSLVKLTAVSVFAAKACFVEEAVWDLCKSRNDYQRYLEIYPDGKHKPEIEELMWQAALQKNDMGGYLGYRNAYPHGIHVPEVDDKVWSVAQANGSYDAYLTNFPNGNHADEVKLMKEAQAEEVDKVKRSENGVITDPFSLSPEHTLADADSLMAKFRISGVPITEGRKLVGIITNRDLKFEEDFSKKIKAHRLWIYLNGRCLPVLY